MEYLVGGMGFSFNRVYSERQEGSLIVEGIQLAQNTLVDVWSTKDMPTFIQKNDASTINDLFAEIFRVINSQYSIDVLKSIFGKQLLYCLKPPQSAEDIAFQDKMVATRLKKFDNEDIVSAISYWAQDLFWSVNKKYEALIADAANDAVLSLGEYSSKKCI